MEIAVLGSGSKGNATIVRSGSTAILLEAGLSARQIALRARVAGFDPDRISALFVSHAHVDHIQGAPVFSRRHRVPTFMTDGAYERWRQGVGRRLLERQPRGDSPGRTPAARRALAGGDSARPLLSTHMQIDRQAASAANTDGADSEGLQGTPFPPNGGARALSTRTRQDERPEVVAPVERAPFHARLSLPESGEVQVGPLRVRAFPVPHDTDGTVGYVVEAEGMRFGYVTDLGHATALVVERLRGCDALLIEMNHDPDLLREGPYPWDVKQRIASRHGHLSNDQGASLLEQALGSDTRMILLGHLSEINNEPAIAMTTARRAVERAGRGDVRVVPAEPHRPSQALRL